LINCQCVFSDLKHTLGLLSWFQGPLIFGLEIQPTFLLIIFKAFPHKAINEKNLFGGIILDWIQVVLCWIQTMQFHVKKFIKMYNLKYFLIKQDWLRTVSWTGQDVLDGFITINRLINHCWETLVGPWPGFGWWVVKLI
jgi:hypothetical protein